VNGSHWKTTHVFDDGEALFDAVWRNGLEGVVAKRLGQRYRSGERGWVKTKNRHYWRYPAQGRRRATWTHGARTFRLEATRV
jgi:ATP-dependent DNA ligase